jgi:hypothetical protein
LQATVGDQLAVLHTVLERKEQKEEKEQTEQYIHPHAYGPLRGSIYNNAMQHRRRITESMAREVGKIHDKDAETQKNGEYYCGQMQAQL